MSTSSDKKDFVLICPRCGSAEVENDLSRDMIVWSGSTRYLCRNCDYSSPFFPEVNITNISQYKYDLMNRSEDQKVIFESFSKSKGILNKKLNLFLLVLNTTYTFVIAIILIIPGFVGIIESPLIEGIGFIIIILSVVFIFRRKKIK